MRSASSITDGSSSAAATATCWPRATPTASSPRPSSRAMRREKCSGDRGWVGDVPRFTYSTAKVRALGWQPKMNSPEAVRRAI